MLGCAIRQQLPLELLQPPELLQLAVAFDDNTGAGQKPDQVNPQWYIYVYIDVNDDKMFD